ncbi:hypothetical protein EVAR_86464_1 [Eumeta japonica]|uniref:Uncharacterized protein n=1 Tax=Eumeta variegata TaxID=151549 RepID=A0A4C1VMH0_EUMVA|nr:hypothetical protein EVAR_86464_1 [Eumeta japonica]
MTSESVKKGPSKGLIAANLGSSSSVHKSYVEWRAYPCAASIVNRAIPEFEQKLLFTKESSPPRQQKNAKEKHTRSPNKHIL